MLEGLNWGMPVVLYLFLAGTGAGALTVSSSVLLRGGGGGFGNQHISIARYGAFLAPLPVIIGSLLLIFELGSYQAGLWFRWLNLYKVVNLSPMSIGTWLLTFFVVVSVLYAYTFLDNEPYLGEKRRHGLRRMLAWIGVPLGIGVGVYTGILLGAMPSRPFWNSPILAMMFMLSALSTGVATIILTRALLHRKGADGSNEEEFHEGAYILAASDVLLIGFELMVVFLFVMFAYLTVGDVKNAMGTILPGGILANVFWLWFVVPGLVVPILIELFYVIPKLLYHKNYTAPRVMEIVVPVVVLMGGFMLRYVVVIAGQITGPSGLDFPFL